MKLFVIEDADKEYRLLFIGNSKKEVEQCIKTMDEQTLVAFLGTHSVSEIINMLSELVMSGPAIFMIAQRCPGCKDGYIPVMICDELSAVFPPCGEEDKLSEYRLT